MLRWLTPFNAWTARLCMYLAVAGLFAIVIVVAWQVFGRYVLNDTPTWAEASALVLVLYVTMFGAAVGVRDARHIGLDSLIVLMIPERHQVWFELTCFALVGIFGALMAWQGGVLALSVMPYKIPILGLSEGLNHIPLVIAGVLIVLFSIEHILARLAGQKVVPSWH
jgi:TRAP-type transport system small permease protein